jgi:hypothetical protein
LQQHRREHGVAILRALALFDTQGHALTIDVTDFERRDFTGTKACAVGDRESRLVLQVAGRADQAHDLLPAQDDGHRAWHKHRLHLRHQLRRSSVTSKKNFNPVRDALREIGEVPLSTKCNC